MSTATLTRCENRHGYVLELDEARRPSHAGSYLDWNINRLNNWRVRPRIVGADLISYSGILFSGTGAVVGRPRDAINAGRVAERFKAPVLTDAGHCFTECHHVLPSWVFQAF